MKGSTGWKGSCCTCKGLPPSWIGTCFLFLQIQSFERFLLLATSTTTTTDSLTLFPSFCRECFLSIDQNISFPFKSNHSNQRVFDSLKTRKREKRFLSIIQKLSLPSIQMFHLLKNVTIQRTPASMRSFLQIEGKLFPFLFSKSAIFLTLNVSFPQESTIQRTLGFAQPSWGGAELSFSFPLLIRTRNGAKCFLFWKDSWHSLLDWDKTFPLYSNPIIKNVSVFYNFNKNVFYGFPGWRRGCYAIISYFCGVEQQSSSF